MAQRHVRSTLGAVVRTVLVLVGGLLVAAGCVAVLAALTGTAGSLPGPDWVATLVVGLGAFLGGLSLAVAGLAVPGRARGPLLGAPGLSADQRRYALAGAVFLNPVLYWRAAFWTTGGWALLGWFARSVLAAPLGRILVGGGLVAVSLGPALVGERSSGRWWGGGAPGADAPAGLSAFDRSLGRRGRALAAAVGVGLILLAAGTVYSVRTTTVSGAHTGGGALGLAIAMIVGLFLAASGLGLVVLAAVAPGQGRLLVRSGPDGERRLVLAGGLLLAGSPVVGLMVVFVGGLQTALLPVAVGTQLVALGGLFRLGTIAHRRLVAAESGP